MADEPKPESLEVDLFDGVKVSLPKEQAQAAIAARQALKESQRKLAEELGQLRADRDAQIKAAKDAKESAELEKMAKNGEIDKIRETLTNKHRDEITKVATRIIDGELADAMGKLSDLVDDAEARRDLRTHLRSSCRYNPDTHQIEVVGQDGKPAHGEDGRPLNVDAFVAGHVAQRAYLRKPSANPGSGAAKGAQPPSGKAITSAQFEAMDPIARAKHFADGGTLLS
jgi:hypothetical protein